MSAPATAKLTLGPLLFHWSSRKRRDFYFRIADEAPIDSVYLGEVVCAKRESEFSSVREDIIARLQAAGKEVVLSTLAMVTTPAEVNAIRKVAESNALIEANDVAAVQLLQGHPFVVGPYINVFNEGSRDFLLGRGATRIVLPVEMSATAIRMIATSRRDTEYEVQVFGRQPLSVAMRCYHARAHERSKDHCQRVCALDADGLNARTIDGTDILTINGTQTLTHGYAVLLDELAMLRTSGVTHFRLSPQEVDMVKVATLYRQVLDEQCLPVNALSELRTLTRELPYINGFVHGRAGMAWVRPTT